VKLFFSDIDLDQPVFTVAAWEKYWQKSRPLFEKVLAKSLFSQNDELKKLLCSDDVPNAPWVLCQIQPVIVSGAGGVSQHPFLFDAREIDALRACCSWVDSDFCVTRQIEDFLDGLRQCPELIGELTQFLEFRRGKHGRGVSRRTFFERHLMSIPLFQKLHEMAESEITSLWKILREIIKTATNWLWKRCLKFPRRLRYIPVALFSVKHFKSEQEKLWPLLMAFKNH